jgi:hypothetical protein
VFVEACGLGIFASRFIFEPFSSTILMELSIVVAIYSIIATFWVSYPALLPLIFDLKVKRKNETMGISTTQSQAEIRLSEKTFFGVQKIFQEVFVNILRDKVPLNSLAADLNLNSSKSEVTSKNLVSIFISVLM